ncbi:MAG: M23 family metallopeptidase [Gammaproteobacteria bacterium]
MELKGDPIFPLKTMPLDWNEPKATRYFGAIRKSGDPHPACDLMVKAGTEVFAVADGKVFFICKGFLGPGLDSIQINHDGFIALYGEVKPVDDLKAGDPVSKGQKIATVGQQTPSMLHFELYITDEKRQVLLPKGGHSKDPEADRYHRAILPADPGLHLSQWKNNFLKQQLVQ